MEPEVKIDAPVQVPAMPRARWRRGVRGVLEYSLLTILLLIIFLSAVGLFRSNEIADHIQVGLWDDEVLLLRSDRGDATLGKFALNRGAYYNVLPKSLHISDPIDSSASSYYVKANERSSLLGLKIIDQIHVAYWIVKAPLNVSYTSVKMPYADYAGGGIRVPHWLVLLVSSLIFTGITLGRRFTLRRVFIWMTILCVILGIAMKIGRDSELQRKLRVLDAIKNEFS